MKILTLIGTRPEIIRLSVIMKKLDEVCTHIIVYTNQNYDPNLSTIFFKDLGIRDVNYFFSRTNSLGEFLANGFKTFEEILDMEKPDKVLVLGDTNSGLFSILAAKRGIPVYHMEAGNRCYDGDVPEETNRRVIDACSTFNLPYTENSKQNLINERFHKNFVFKTGNPINEVLNHYMTQINATPLDAIPIHMMDPTGGYIDLPFVLLSFHRTENVDNPERVRAVMKALNVIAQKVTIVFPIHPHTKDKFQSFGVQFEGDWILLKPVGFFEFVKLEKSANVVITDSGTVPEETSLFGVPTIVLRNTTERQELMENGTLILAGTYTEDIIRAFETIEKLKHTWAGLDDYDKLNVSDTVVKLLIGQNIQIETKGHDKY